MNPIISFIVGCTIAGADIALLALLVGNMGKGAQGRMMLVMVFLLLKFPLLAAAIYGMSQAAWFDGVAAAAGLILPFAILLLVYSLRQFKRPVEANHGN